MNLIKKLKDTVAHIKQGDRGKRFIDYYDYRKKRDGESLARYIVMLILGILMIGMGIIGALLPILPGFLLFIPGIAIIAARSRIVAKSLDRIEVLIRKTVGKS